MLLSTWVTSLVAALFHAVAPVGRGADASPDWQPGALFGLGGMAGVYAGTHLLARFPPRIVKSVLSAVLLLLAGGICSPP